MIATLDGIRRGEFGETFRIADILLHDDHDLIHKAVGWLLREVGKRDGAAERAFLESRYKTMPRTMLRYAIERFPEGERRRYLKGGSDETVLSRGHDDTMSTMGLCRVLIIVNIVPSRPS